MPVQRGSPPLPSRAMARLSRSQLRRWTVINRLPGNQTVLYFLPRRGAIHFDPRGSRPVCFVRARMWGPIQCHQRWTWWEQMGPLAAGVGGRLQLQLFIFSLHCLFIWCLFFYGRRRGWGGIRSFCCNVTEQQWITNTQTGCDLTHFTISPGHTHEGYFSCSDL